MTSIIWRSARAVHPEPRIESSPKFLRTPPMRAPVGSLSQCSREAISSNRKRRGIWRIRFLFESLDTRSLMATIGAAKMGNDANGSKTVEQAQPEEYPVGDFTRLRDAQGGIN